MGPTRFTTTQHPDFARYQALLNVDPKHPHVHLVDMPFRFTSTWQDHGCAVGTWERDDTILAWALFQPPWGTLDHAFHPSVQGSTLEEEVFAWGHEQMIAHAQRTGQGFPGVIEIFENTPHVERTLAHVQELGFEQLEENALHFELDLGQTFPSRPLPEGYTVRPFAGEAEIQAYVDLVDAVFGPSWMSAAWRRRTPAHPAYLRELDLVAVHEESGLVGFCSAWHWHDVGQIEPLGVHPDHRGKGLGRALERAVIGAMQDQGVRFLYVDHGTLNEKAKAVSRRNGFRQVNTILRYGIEIRA